MTTLPFPPPPDALASSLPSRLSPPHAVSPAVSAPTVTAARATRRVLLFIALLVALPELTTNTSPRNQVPAPGPWSRPPPHGVEGPPRRDEQALRGQRERGHEHRARDHLRRVLKAEPRRDDPPEPALPGHRRQRRRRDHLHRRGPQPGHHQRVRQRQFDAGEDLAAAHAHAA